MSTHNIGFYEDLTKIIFQLSSNIIKYAPSWDSGVHGWWRNRSPVTSSVRSSNYADSVGCIISYD